MTPSQRCSTAIADEGSLVRYGADEIDSIFSYIHESNRAAAAAVVKRIEGLASLLADFPLIGHLTDEAGVRSLSVVRYPFMIFYAIDKTMDEVVILHVRHTAQDRP